MSLAPQTEPEAALPFCDLVMKGGITSGVVYPSAVARLARAYRLRSIGGASAGAIAAAGAAAAEYRRQTDPLAPEAGFERLAGLGAELGQPQAGGDASHSRLFHLFAPTRLAAPLFTVLAGMLNRRTPGARLAFGCISLVRAFPTALVAGVVLLGVALTPVLLRFGPGATGSAGGPGDALTAAGAVLASAALVLFTVAALLAFALWRSLRRFARVMASQDFGLCTGMREHGLARPEALTEWLHQLFQGLSGKEGARPLTFGDLRRIGFRETPGRDGIVLRVMTTCLTAGRPYTLPLDERFYFDPVEWRRLFPREVLRWMVENRRPPRSAEERDDDALAGAHQVGSEPRPLLAIPEPDDFPVIAAIRMSLSFPLLLSAVPLYRPSVRKEGEAWTRYLARLLFTDGGVCSNLPIHLFDAPLPAWPTFAINLRDDLPEGSPEVDRVVPPRRGRSYQGERYSIPTTPTLGSTVSFLTAIVNTMQNWHDALQRGAAGSKERVFTVRHTAREGGLNLDMDREAISTMATSGERAADAIVTSFRPPPGTSPADDDWQYHRWVRLRLLLPVLEQFIGGIDEATRAQTGPPTFGDLLTAAPPPMGRSFELNLASRAAGWALLQDLTGASQRVRSTGADFERTSPRPAGTLRVTPTF